MRLFMRMPFLVVGIAAATWPAPARLSAQQPTKVVFPSFERVMLLEENGETSAGVSVGDLNGDGRPDVVLGKGRHWPLFNRILLNDGKGGFTASNLGKAPDRTYSAALADLDGDGDLDVVVSNDEPDRKLVYFNDGQANFTEGATFGDPSWSTRYVTLGDLNGDGFPDIVAANRAAGPGAPRPSFLCLNDHNGHFPVCDTLPTESATSIVAADLDGDGKPDLFVPHRDGGQCVILWGDGQGRFPALTGIGSSATWARIGVAADFNGDGKLDLAYIEERKRAAFVVLNRGGRTFGEPVRAPGAAHTPYALAAADLNRDGRPDLVVGWVELPGSVFYNTSAGRNAPLSWREVPWNDGKGTVYGIAFADFDGDDWLDIVAARSDAPNGIWFSTRKRR
jgi:hypothetical protein